MPKMEDNKANKTQPHTNKQHPHTHTHSSPPPPKKTTNQKKPLPTSGFFPSFSYLFQFELSHLILYPSPGSDGFASFKGG